MVNLTNAYIKSLTNYFICSIFLLFSSSLFAQEINPIFSGTITYEIEYYDTIQSKFVSTNTNSVYIIDSLLVRSENDSRLGRQILIKDVQVDTARLLFNALGVDYAVYIDYNADKDTTEKENNFKKTNKKNDFGGIEGVLYVNKETEPNEEYYVTPTISQFYNPIHEEIDGFPLQYTLNIDGMLLRYTCIGISPSKPNSVLFKIPKTFKFVTLEEFYSIIQSQN